MTSIPLDAIMVDGKRLDQYKRYLIVPPDGGKPTGYTRVTTVAKVMDPGGGLMPWKATMAACGMILRRGLRAQWETLIAEFDNPWYATEASKAACKQLVEECAAVGGANDRAEMGLALHAITALLDQGKTPKHLTEETETDLKAYVETLAETGIVLDPSYVEKAVVLDDWLVAGTFDRIAHVPGFDLPLIADLKTGADLSYGWQSFAIQLAAYSRANHIYQQGSKTDGSEDQRLPMPQVDQQYGLILWLNAGGGALELHMVDLELGWEGFQQSMAVRMWQKRRVAQPFEGFQPKLPPSEPDSLVPVLEASIAQAQAAPVKRGRGRPRKNPQPDLKVLDAEQPNQEEPPDDQQADRAEESPSSSTPTAPTEDDEETAIRYTADLRQWLQGRINAIGRITKARDDLLHVWPTDLPTLMGCPVHTPDQLAAIEETLKGVEKRHKLAFPPERPQAGPMGTILHWFPNSTTNHTKDDAS